LTDNYQQNQAINMMQLSTASPIEIFSQFIDTLEEAKLVDRAIEFLPSKAELNKRSINKENLTRPELCVILSYSKSWAYHDLLTTTFSQDEYFESYLINYFPKSMQEKFREEILSHPLKYEIIRTVVTNKIINQLGGTAIDIIKRQTGATFADIIRSYIIICEIFDLENLWNSVEFLPNTIDYKIKADMFTELAKIMRRGICWFITHTQRPINISNIIAELSEPAKSLSQIIGNCLLGEAKVKFDDKIKGYTLSNVPSILAYSIATLDSLISAFDIIYTAKETKFGNSAIANLYFAIGNKFSIDWLRKCCDQQLNDSYWNRLATQSIKDDLYDKQRRLLTKIIMQSKIIIDLDLWSNDYIDDATIFLDFINKIKSNGNVDLNILILANKKLETFICKLG
jgi:glutamate dehydrogenase